MPNAKDWIEDEVYICVALDYEDIPLELSDIVQYVRFWAKRLENDEMKKDENYCLALELCNHKRVIEAIILECLNDGIREEQYARIEAHGKTWYMANEDWYNFLNEKISSKKAIDKELGLWYNGYSEKEETK